MKIDLKDLEVALVSEEDPISIDLDIDTEANVVELVKDFSAKILDFLTKMRSSSTKIKEQLDAFTKINTDVNEAEVLDYTIYDYPQERFSELAEGYVNATKDVRSIVRYLSNDKLDNADKLADRVARYLGRKNDMFKLKKDPEAVGRSRDTLKDHGFSIADMVKHMGAIRSHLTSSKLNSLRKEVERIMSNADEDDAWVKVAYKFSVKAINELADINLELGNQQLKMVKILTK